MRLLKSVLGVSIILSLSACDEQQTVQKEIKKKIDEFQNVPKEENKISYNPEEPTLSDIYGFWVNKESYIVISHSYGRYQLKQYVKNESQNTKLFTEVIQTGKNSFSGIFLNDEDLGDKLSLKLNDRKDELTIETENGKNTYKYTNITPDAYIMSF